MIASFWLAIAVRRNVLFLRLRCGAKFYRLPILRLRYAALRHCEYITMLSVLHTLWNFFSFHPFYVHINILALSYVLGKTGQIIIHT